MKVKPMKKFWRNNIALAFRELAENAGKIGTLNISPDLLDTVLKK